MIIICIIGLVNLILRLKIVYRLYRMKLLKTGLWLCSSIFLMTHTYAHYPYVAPLSYQTFNNHSAIVSGFYDNPFSPEIAIKNFKFHYHNPQGEKIEIADEQWAKTQTLSSMSLENKVDGTYRIRGVKQGATTQFALDEKMWKVVITGKPVATKPASTKVIYESQLDKKNKVKTVQVTEIIETFVSRKNTSNKVFEHLHDGLDIQFLTHPNAIRANQPIHLKLIDNKKGISNLGAEVLTQTVNFSRDTKVYKEVTTDEQGNLNFTIKDKGQYLLKIDYQQPFDIKSDSLKRYKYTLSFNVI